MSPTMRNWTHGVDSTAPIQSSSDSAVWMSGALLRMEKEIEDRLAFNVEWGLTRLPGEIRRTRDAALVDTILGITGLDRQSGHVDQR